MAITDILSDENNSWPRMPFVVRLGDDITSLKEAMTYQLAHEFRLERQRSGNSSAIAELLSTGDDKANPKWFTRPHFADTRVGGNDAINCIWQFNRDDDIVHPITQSREGDSQGLGRVYNEMIESNQHIVWFTFGVAEYGDLFDFYKTAIKNDLVTLMRNGEASMMEQIGSLLSKTAGLAVSLPLMPLIWLDKILHFSQTTKVTRYYDFRQTMLLYYEFVNSILVHLSTNMGMYGENKETGQYAVDPANPGYVPQFMRTTGPDIFAIIQRKSIRAGMAVKTTSTEQRLAESVNGDPNRKTRWWQLFISNEVTNYAMGASDFLGFRIEKSVDSSESFSNQTGESSIASTLNSKASSAIDKSYSTGQMLTDVKGLLTGIAEAVGIDGLANAYLGSAFVDIPDIWKSSSFGKSHSLSFQLRAMAGDPVSIMQSVYIPLACILAGALPRAVGKNAFTSPFLCRCYCKGMFSVPMGMIDSISIKRGSSEFGWNDNCLPTQVDVSLTIKDLTPAMYMALGTDSWRDIFGQNSSFQEYLLTLSGMGLSERILFFKNMKRRAQIYARIKSSTSGYLGFIGGNPHYQSARIGESGIARTIAAITPYALLPRN